MIKYCYLWFRKKLTLKRIVLGVFIYVQCCMHTYLKPFRCMQKNPSELIWAQKISKITARQDLFNNLTFWFSQQIFFQISIWNIIIAVLPFWMQLYGSWQNAFILPFTILDLIYFYFAIYNNRLVLYFYELAQFSNWFYTFL